MRKRPFTSSERKAKRKAWSSEWASLHPERRKVNNRKSYYMLKYGRTFESVKAILSSQDNKCAICNISIIFDGPTGAHLDHIDDVKIRGVLCAKCNKGLGLFNDNITILFGAINYLRNFSGWGKQKAS